MLITNILQSGVSELLEYLSAHVLTCLVPAFFIAGGIAAVVSNGAVLKYFGPRAKKTVAYGVASVSGAILAVCSCTVLPLFAGIHKSRKLPYLLLCSIQWPLYWVSGSPKMRLLTGCAKPGDLSK